MHLRLGVGVCIFTILACSTGPSSSDQARGLLSLGTQKLLAGDYDQAFELLNRSAQIDPDNAVTQNNLGLIYFMRKDYGQAQEAFQRALALKPDYSEARNNLARVYIALTRYDDAVTELDKVIKDLNFPTVEKAYINMGLALMKKGNVSSALVQFKKSIDANGKFCPAHNYYGQALFSLQKYDEALESFETALKLCHNKYDEAQYYRALSYYKTGQPEKATDELVLIKKQYPGTDIANKSEEMLKLMR